MFGVFDYLWMLDIIRKHWIHKNYYTPFSVSRKNINGGMLGGVALPLWRWRGCKAPKTPYFQRCCHPMTPYFCWLSLLSLKDPHFMVKCGLFYRSHPRPPFFFLHLAATGSYFLFQFHRLIDHFSHFRRFFPQIPAFKALTERSKVTFSPNAP